MRGIAETYPHRPRGDAAHERLAEAYRTVFDGEYGRLVLIDLCHHCKMFENVSLTPGVDMTQVLVDFNARRSVYGRILEFLRLTADEISQLERSAAVERAADRYEGTA